MGVELLDVLYKLERILRFEEMQETSEMGTKIPAGEDEVGLLESALPWP